MPRPVTPFYPAVTDAIETNAFAAMWNGKPVDQAISDMQKAMESASSSG